MIIFCKFFYLPNLVKKSTFYANYNDMGALIAELYNEVLNTMFSVLEEALEGTYPVSKADEIKALSVLLTYMADNRDLFCTLYSHDESSLFVRHMT